MLSINTYQYSSKYHDYYNHCNKILPHNYYHQLYSHNINSLQLANYLLFHHYSINLCMYCNLDLTSLHRIDSHFLYIRRGWSIRRGFITFLWDRIVLMCWGIIVFSKAPRHSHLRSGSCYRSNYWYEYN